MANQDEFANQDELNHETDLGRSFQQPKRPSMNLYRGRSSLEEPRPMPADEHDGYSAVKYYSTFQEPGKMQHATHGSAGDLAALDQAEDSQRTNVPSKRPQSASAKPGRSDIEERLAAGGSAATASTTTSSSQSGKGRA